MREIRTFVRAGSSARGFSLIELLLVILIIAVLISLLAPSLKQVKDRAERVAAFSRFAGLGKGFIAYTADFKDTWPYLTDPNATWTILRAPHIDMGVEYWDIYCWWHVPLSELVYKLPWTDVSFRQNRRELPGPTPFWYSSAFLADPRFFVPSSRVGRNQWRATRVDEVLFPSRKALLVNGGAWDDGKKSSSPLPMVFADASAAEVPSNATLGWNPNGTGSWDPGGGFFAPIAGMTTLEGVRGRDRQ
ncbi:MAG: prepilin-type N-terminal cleavage/methylation domain-containing protein [Phycisphaerales bacterium]